MAPYTFAFSMVNSLLFRASRESPLQLSMSATTVRMVYIAVPRSRGKVRVVQLHFLQDGDVDVGVVDCPCRQ